MKGKGKGKEKGYLICSILSATPAAAEEEEEEEEALVGFLPSLSVISNNREPTPSPLKRPLIIAAVKKPRLSIYFTNKPNKKPRHHLPKEAAAAPPPPITAAVKKPKKPHKPHDGDTSSGACAVNVNKVTKSRNLPKAAVDVNVNVKTVTVKKKETNSFYGC